MKQLLALTLILPILAQADIVYDQQAADRALQFDRYANQFVSCLFIRQSYLLRQGERDERTIIGDSTAMCKVSIDAWVQGFTNGAEPDRLFEREYSAARNVLKIITTQ